MCRSGFVLDLWTPISRDPLIGFAYIWTCLDALDRVYLCTKYGSVPVTGSGDIRVQRSGTNFDYYNGILGVVVRIFGTNWSGWYYWPVCTTILCKLGFLAGLEAKLIGILAGTSGQGVFGKFFFFYFSVGYIWYIYGI